MRRRVVTRKRWIRSSATGLAACLVVLGVLFAPRNGSAVAQDEGVAPSPPIVLITGANRGLGHEFARQFKAAGATVIGTARRPHEADDLKMLGVRVEQLDVTDAESVARLGESIGEGAIDILINNAGIGGRALSIEKLDIDDMEDFFQVNCLGPMRVTQALLPALRRGQRKLIVNITSRLGSIELNTRGGYYGYRESKAALNMFNRTLARELAPDGFTCIVMSPGWVRTRLGGPGARLSPEQSIAGMMGVIKGLTTEDSGKFLDYRGRAVPW